MKKADYQNIAQTFDQSRSITEQNIRIWLDQVSRLCNRREKLADLGCGTGRFSIPLAYTYDFLVTGIDNSEAMLKKAREKDTLHKITWKLKDLEDFDEEEQYSIVFMSHLLHHITDNERLLARCYKLLYTGGKIFIRHGAMEQIENDVEHTFFPETLEIDRRRTFYTDHLETLLKKTGFIKIKTVKLKQKTYKNPVDHLNRVSLKSTSVLTLINEDEFAAGLKRLKKYISENPEDSWLVNDEMSLTSGYKEGL